MMSDKMCENDSREDIVKVFAMFDVDSTNKVSFRNRTVSLLSQKDSLLHWVSLGVAPSDPLVCRLLLLGAPSDPV